MEEATLQTPIRPLKGCLYTRVLFNRVYRLLGDFNSHHLHVLCRVKRGEAAAEPRTGAEHEADRAPPLCYHACFVMGAPRIFAGRRFTCPVRCVQHMHDSAHVERQPQIGTFPQGDLGS